MKKNQRRKLLTTLPTPEELKGYMPRMNKQGMLTGLINGDMDKIGDITLMALLIGTVNMLMNEHEDWEQYLDVGNDSDSESEEEVPEPCGDPECEGCAQLEKAIAYAKENGGTIKAVRLTKKQAMEMGIIDENGNDIKKGVGHCKDDDGSTGKVIH